MKRSETGLSGRQSSAPRLLVRDRAWLEQELRNGLSINDISAKASVSPATTRNWIRRHSLTGLLQLKQINDLRTQYQSLGSIKALAVELGVAPETARQRLIEAGVELKRPGRQEGVHVVDVDVNDLKRRRAGGQSLRSIAAEVGIDWRTVKKLLGEQGTASTGKRPVQKG